MTLVELVRYGFPACRSTFRNVFVRREPSSHYVVGGWRRASSSLPQKEMQESDVEGGNALANREPQQMEADSSIEDILVRSRRKDIITRVGPAAVRYMPTEDPHAFLLPDNRLEPAERKWQRLFVALPWLTFAAMLALPVLLVHTNLPYLVQRAEHEKQAAGKKLIPLSERVPDFQIVNFGQMPDVLERPFPTMLILFHPATLASKVFVPAMRDLEGILRNASIPVTVAALDLTASPMPPEAFLWEYPAAVSPHIQLILPRSMEGEAGVLDHDGGWNAHSLAAAASRLAGPRAPEIPAEEISRLDNGIQRLRDLLFELLFLQEMPAQDNRRKASWWRRWLHLVPHQDPSAVDAAERDRWQAIYQVEQEIDLLHGLDAAIASCETALHRLQQR
ncbi:unnamed protein product [Symbiodinium pilosum]|uniref:Uncharacterized protein n=1 Tax=Symbiodinium pilosum TaxID=2952 RepID=A0A812VTN4_SYMPI|nr:unnamed protein product [Symbiodinium pilosum]